MAGMRLTPLELVLLASLRRRPVVEERYVDDDDGSTMEASMAALLLGRT